LPYTEKSGKILSIVETAELLNIFLIVLFDVGCAAEKGCVGNHLIVSSITARKSSMNVD
jgi:hypothetical protein